MTPNNAILRERMPYMKWDLKSGFVVFSYWFFYLIIIIMLPIIKQFEWYSDGNWYTSQRSSHWSQWQLWFRQKHLWCTKQNGQNLGKTEIWLSSRFEIDLHTALLGKGLGGGIAYVGQICSSSRGFSVSASLGGSFKSMDNGVVWDM